MRRAFVLLIGTAAALAPSPAALAREELTALSEFFAIKRVSGGLGAYRWEGQEIYALVPGKAPEHIGTIEGGGPRGIGLTAAEASHLRATSMAIAPDGRALVFRQWAAAPKSRLAPGIYRYVQGAGIKLVHPEKELSGQFYGAWEKPLPADVLPFKYESAHPSKGLMWALNAGGEEFPLALLEATPLHRAAFEGRTADCTVLIGNGAEVNAKTHWDFTPLDLAIIQDHEDTAIQLLALGADRDSGAYPAFHRAVGLARMKVVQAMIDRGANVNAADSRGYTPLHLAVFAGARMPVEFSMLFGSAVTPGNATTPLVQMLLDKGADPGLRDKNGKNPLDMVSNTTPAEVRELLSQRLQAQP